MFTIRFYNLQIEKGMNIDRQEFLVKKAKGLPLNLIKDISMGMLIRGE